MDRTMPNKPKIAYIAGPNATIHFSPALITSNKARAKHRLPLATDEHGRPVQFDMLRPQKLAAPARVYIEQFSAHPLERDAQSSYGPPDGYLDRSGAFHKERQGDEDIPVFEAELLPEDGLYLLPYMALRHDGSAWENDAAIDWPANRDGRQAFFPDGARVVEEIDRFEVTDDGLGNGLSRIASFDFFRIAPSGGYTQQGGDGDRQERLGVDYFPYRPAAAARHPPRSFLARIANEVQRIAASGDYEGVLWTQGSPRIEETLYWLSLMVDTHVPIVGCAAQRGHRQLGDDGAKNIFDAASYIASRAWANESGGNILGAVLIQEQQIFAARDVQKGDARPGAYLATGGHGGILGGVGFGRNPKISYLPATRFNANSQVSITRLPDSVSCAAKGGQRFDVQVKDKTGWLLPTAIPRVSIIKDGNFVGEDDDADSGPDELVIWMTNDVLARKSLSGFVVEGLAPYGTPATVARHKALEHAVRCGLPVVCVGRGNNEGFTPPSNLFLGGQNLTATKARLLLMACLLRFGSLPPMADPGQPSSGELSALRQVLARYQAVFDTH